MVAGLPEGSALHRTKFSGRTWTSQHVMLWAIAQLITTMDAHLIQSSGGKAKTPPWREFPWTASKDRSTRTLGQRGRLSERQVKDWLDSMRPASQRTK